MQRPKRRENEEDLLRFQEQFMRQGTQPSAKVQRIAKDSHGKTEKARDVVSLSSGGTGSMQDTIPKKSRFKMRREEILKNVAKEDENADASFEEQDNHITTMLTKIQERYNVNPKRMKQNKFHGGFPAVPLLGKGIDDQSNVGKKQSLFAKQFMSQNMSAFGLQQQDNVSFQSESRETERSTMKETKSNEEKSPVPMDTDISSVEHSLIITGEGLCTGKSAADEKGNIHKENLLKLTKMTECEIKEERAKLEAALDPKLLDFIKRKRTVKPRVRSEDQKISIAADIDVREQSTISDVRNEKKGPEAKIDFNPHKQFNIDKNLPGMDVIEDEKLQWIKDSPKPVYKDGKAGTIARFDLEGNVVPRNANIPAERGLHHHGEDPALAGYSLEELFHLARSNFLQQRVFALKMLARIMEKFHQGCFDDKLQGSLMQQLLDAGLPFLLRWALDDSTDAVYSAAIYAFAALLTIPDDNVALDKLLYVDGGFQVSCLRPLNSVDKMRRLKKEENRELTDPEIIAFDLIKGLLKIQLLPRLRYILEMCEPDSVTIDYCMLILSRLALHSTESSYLILKCPRLVETIFTKLLPITWSDSSMSCEKLPCCNALRLVRILCTAGKSIASKLWNDFDLSARVIRYSSSVSEEIEMRENAIALAVESVHTWRICLLHGVAISTTIDVYSLLVSLLQKYTTNDEEQYLNLRSSLVMLAEGVLRMTSSCSLEKEPRGDSSRKVHFSDEVDDAKVTVDWNMVSGIHSILWQSVRKEGKEFSLKKSKSYMACLLLYLAAYAENAYKQKTLDKVKLLSEMETWMNELLLNIIQSDRVVQFMDELRDFSDFMRPADSICENKEIESFPNHGMKVLRGNCRCLDRQSPVVFLSSLAKLLHRIVVVNKGCCQEMMSFFNKAALLEYLRKFASTSSVAYQLSTVAVSSAVERKFIRHVLSLFQITSCYVGAEQIDPALAKTYHLAAFKLVSIFRCEELGQAVSLMNELLFQGNMYLESEPYSLAEKLKVLEISSTESRQDSVNIQFLLNDAQKNLPDICSVYVANCCQAYERDAEFLSRLAAKDVLLSKDSFFSSHNRGSLLPIDWLFLPIVNLYNLAINVELGGKVIQQLSTDSVQALEMNLSFILLLEIYRPEALECVADAIKLVRILCVFLIGNDAFLESPIYHLLQSLASIYMGQEKLDNISFQIKFPGIASFYDLFTSLLAQFSATSFGDSLFSNFLLIPLQQKHDVEYRKALWSENCETLRVFSLPLKSVKLHLSNFLDAVEEDEELLQLYFKNIANGQARPSWCPLFYLIAVHHLSNYVFNTKETIKDFSSMKITQSRLQLLDKIISSKNEEAKLDVLLYEKEDIHSPKGFRTYESLPGYRQLIIENRNKEFN